MPRDSRVYLDDILAASARIHSYSVDLDIIWDIVANKLPAFEDRVRLLLEGSGG